MSILVTGGAGFIGSHLGEALLRAGRDVIALDSFDDFYNPAVKRAGLATCLAHARFRLVEGDIRNEETVRSLLQQNDVEMIVHLAARAGVRPSIERPLLYQDVNIRGTMVLLEAAHQCGVDKFVFASSSSVYGNNKKVPFAESDNVDFPISPYAATKKAGELVSHAYHHLYGMHVTCLRFFTVYGPRQRPDLAIHKFARLIESGKPIPVFGDGSMLRDHTYIDDIVDGVLRAMEHCNGYHIYNLGESQPVSLADLIKAIEAALGKKAILKRLPVPAGDVVQTYADLSLSRAELGYRPQTDLKHGLVNFVSWLRDEQAAVAVRG